MHFYATIALGHTRPDMPDVCGWLLPASSWHRANFAAPRVPRLTRHHYAADSGGFAATQRGGYAYTLDEYCGWLETFRPAWAATMDYACQGAPESTVIDRQQATTDNAHATWHAHRQAPWAWVPTVQGNTPDDYAAHAHQLSPLLSQMRAHYAARGMAHLWRVGIGSCVGRTPRAISHIVHAVAAALPGTPFHLWGGKLSTLKASLPQVISVDTYAWDPHGQHADGLAARAERTALGLTQSQYAMHIALPRYLARFDAATRRPTQPHLF